MSGKTAQVIINTNSCIIRSKVLNLKMKLSEIDRFPMTGIETKQEQSASHMTSRLTLLHILLHLIIVHRQHATCPAL